MDITGAAVNRAPYTMVMKLSSSQVAGNRIGAVSKISVKPRRELSGGFRDAGHVVYYQKKGITAMEMVSCGGGLVVEKSVKKDEKKILKKKMKLFKGLTKDLSMFSQTELLGEADPEGISRAAETLLQHLEEMKSKEKMLKKKRKMEKSLMKAAKAANCELSSSSESSDSECGEVVDLKGLRPSIKPKAPNDSSQVVSVVMTPSIPLKLEAETCKLSSSNVAETTVNKKIEVCMGGKCKKSGAAQLVEEFEKFVGEGAVVGCKCMGKCRDGPNVRVLSSEASVNDLGMSQASSVNPPPLCAGVGLDDVGIIVANFLGGGFGSSCGDHVNLAVVAAT